MGNLKKYGLIKARNVKALIELYSTQNEEKSAAVVNDGSEQREKENVGCSAEMVKTFSVHLGVYPFSKVFFFLEILTL